MARLSAALWRTKATTAEILAYEDAADKRERAVAEARETQRKIVQRCVSRVKRERFKQGRPNS